ncbi:LOW QUALITY PROTEIN: predicted protein, partial [Brucella sp. 83/13]
FPEPDKSNATKCPCQGVRNKPRRRLQEATSKSVARTCEFLTFTETSKCASFGRNWIDHYTGGGK